MNKKQLVDEFALKLDEFYENLQLQHASHSLTADEFYEQAETYDNCPENWNQIWWDKMCNKNREDRIRIAATLLASELDRVIN